MLSDKQKALVLHMIEVHDWSVREAIEGVQSLSDPDNIERQQIGYYDCGQRDFTVYTDSEADAEWERYLESYLDDCVYPELPEDMQYYFDEEKWKNDARMDGRGHCLNGWDGNEWPYKINDEWFYIYEN